MAMIDRVGALGLLLATLLAAPASAATPGQKCEATKLKLAGLYDLCLLKAQAKGVKRPGLDISGDMVKCDQSLASKWDQAESKGGTACPTTGDRGALQSILSGLANVVNGRLGELPYIDNLDGTITDTRSGLMWEQKDAADGSPNYADAHDVDNVYTWSTTGVVPDGTAFTAFLGSLNNCVNNGDITTGGLAGHCDWRLPTYAELLTIFDRQQPNCPGAVPCIDPIFLPVAYLFPGAYPIGADAYWSSISSSPGTGAQAWSYDFFSFSSELKTNAHAVRAVRNLLPVASASASARVR